MRKFNRGRQGRVSRGGGRYSENATNVEGRRAPAMASQVGSEPSWRGRGAARAEMGEGAGGQGRGAGQGRKEGRAVEDDRKRRGDSWL